VRRLRSAHFAEVTRDGAAAEDLLGARERRDAGGDLPAREGLDDALQKPVVLVSSNEKDVPFDVQHIRVIYYNVLDPFWGEKLIAKIAENVLSALQNPGEAILRKPV
jgi:hypothetical protein